MSRAESTIASSGVVAVFAVAGAVAWTLAGCLLSLWGPGLESFLRVWGLSQSGLAVFFGIFLGFLSRGSTLSALMKELDPNCGAVWHRMPLSGFPIVAFVAVIGTFTTTNLGFPLRQPSLAFMWITCGVVCFLAGCATVHAIEIVLAARCLDRLKLRLFAISPGETKALRRLASYFSVFGGVLTGGYIITFIGTISVDWTGPTRFVRSVQLLWPMIYVPLCLTVITYPLFSIRSIVRREKDRLLSRYQEEINSILENSDLPSIDDIERVNALVDIIRRIDESPDYALSLPVAVTTVSSYVLQIGSLLVPREAAGEWLRKLLL